MPATAQESAAIRLSHRKHAIDTCRTENVAKTQTNIVPEGRFRRKKLPSSDVGVIRTVVRSVNEMVLIDVGKCYRAGTGRNWTRTMLLMLCLCAGSALARPNISAAVPATGSTVPVAANQIGTVSDGVFGNYQSNQK